ncbi:hypothetical protein [Mesorhizobium australicum]|uniref:hypothetical protein n=1 Tax=Mesorhizobium australicum TaxID=536018 RepID=UPI00333830F3
MVVAEIATGYSALRSAYEIVKGLKDTDDRVKLNSAVIDLQEQIITAQEGAGAARDKIREMEATIAAHEDWNKIADLYQLKDFGDGTFAYELTPGVSNEPLHLACPNCFQSRKRSILQFFDTYVGRRRYECMVAANR